MILVVRTEEPSMCVKTCLVPERAINFAETGTSSVMIKRISERRLYKLASVLTYCQ